MTIVKVVEKTSLEASGEIAPTDVYVEENC
jgi:hypothetical protein